MQCISNMLKYYKMQNSSPDTDPARSILYNDSGYFTNHNPDPQSYSSNSNSDPSFEVTEEVSLHAKYGECLPTLPPSTSGIYFCDDAVFDEPKLVGPPLLCDNTNNYEQFSSLIKFSLEETSGSYLTNNTNLHSLVSLQDSSNSQFCDNLQESISRSTNVLQYFDHDSLSSLSSINPSQPICVSEIDNQQTIISQAVAECLTVSESQIKSDIEQESCDNTKPEYSKVEIRTCAKTFTNPDQSPELFSEDDESILEAETSVALENVSQTQKHTSPNEQFLRNDRKLLKRVQENLSGVPPPPSVTILQLTVSEMLEKIYSNKQLFLSAKTDDTESKSVENKSNLSESVCTEEKSVKSLLICSTKEEVHRSEWPATMNYRYHGLYYNRSKASEELEWYCSRYLSRYVGAETASSCTAWAGAAPSSAAKRRLRWAARSPGRRLSHLARRRITFSSANLHQPTAARPLMIDPRKNVPFNKRRSPRKSPWKKSPQKRIKTPNSSKKRSCRRAEEDPKPGCSAVSSTKRALFQSPEHTRATATCTSTSDTLQRNKSKRALFISPSKKRKRADEDAYPSKFPRSLSFDVQQPSDAGSRHMLRRNSEVLVRTSSGKGELSELHKQKMLWAVSEALRAQQISMSHPQFRPFASILCKVIKQLVPDLMSNGPRQPGSTSDRMLRIARQHSYAVTRGKSFDEVIQQVREAHANMKNLKAPTGYVAPEKNILQDKVMNIDTNSRIMTKTENGFDDNSKLRSIRRQIVFDDNEITKSCNTNR